VFVVTRLASTQEYLEFNSPIPLQIGYRLSYFGIKATLVVLDEKFLVV
jgi:hypothetical protein